MTWLTERVERRVGLCSHSGCVIDVDNSLLRRMGYVVVGIDHAHYFSCACYLWLTSYIHSVKQTHQMAV